MMTKYRAKPLTVESSIVTDVTLIDVPWPQRLTLYDLMTTYDITPLQNFVPESAALPTFHLNQHNFCIALITTDEGVVFRTLCDKRFSQRRNVMRGARFRVATQISTAATTERLPDEGVWPLQINWKLASAGNMLVHYTSGIWTITSHHHHAHVFEPESGLHANNDSSFDAAVEAVLDELPVSTSAIIHLRDMLEQRKIR